MLSSPVRLKVPPEAHFCSISFYWLAFILILLSCILWNLTHAHSLKYWCTVLHLCVWDENVSQPCSLWGQLFLFSPDFWHMDDSSVPLPTVHGVLCRTDSTLKQGQLASCRALHFQSLARSGFAERGWWCNSPAGQGRWRQCLCQSRAAESWKILLLLVSAKYTAYCRHWSFSPYLIILYS